MAFVLVEWQKGLLALLPKILIALVIFAVGLYFSRLVSDLARRVMKRRQVDAGAENLLAETVRWGIIIYGTIMALQQFADVTAFLAGLGILGFTVGFALQDVMKNFAAGVLLLLQRPFRIGESIAVGDYSGTVMALDLRATEIKTFDGRTVIVPNADVLNHAIVNYTRSVERQIELSVGVAYESDLAEVRRLALESLAGLTGLLPNPAPQVVFKEFGSSSINLVIYFWVDTDQASLFGAQDEALNLVNATFTAHGIKIPYPTHTVLMQK